MEARRQLRLVAIVAVVDAVLLAALLAGSFRDADAVTGVLGPLHGAVYLLELFLTARGAGEGWWGWRFPILVLITGGPPGAAIGHARMRRRWASSPTTVGG